MVELGLPDWWKKLFFQHRQGVGRIFILHGNVNDVVYCPPPSESDDLFRIRPTLFRDFLINLLLKNGFGPVFYCSPTLPLTFHFHENGVPKRSQVNAGKIQAALERCISSNPQALWSTFGDQIAHKAAPAGTDIHNLLFTLEPLLERTTPSWWKMVLILDFFERITTVQEAGGRSTHGSADYESEEIIRRWALSDSLKQSHNMVIGLTPELNDLPRLICASNSQILQIDVPLPDPGERSNFLSYWREPIGETERKLKLTWDPASFEFQSQEGKQEPDHLASLANFTKGFRLLDLETVIRMAKAEDPDGLLKDDHVREQKAKLIREESGGLLEEVRDKGAEKRVKKGFDAIGGLDYAVGYFKHVARAIIGRAPSVPKGILLAGPPGTGKTILAKALAQQANITLVKLGDIRGSYVGESERNLTRALSLLKALAPVVVFVDEIDQSLGRRTTSADGDSGVSRRIFGRLLEFMGDRKNRGDVLWIGASNRPDLLDEAMISRFDAVLAILFPYTAKERSSILSALENPDEHIVYSPELKSQLDQIAEKFGEVSGRAIETIVRKASEIAASGPIQPDHLQFAIDLYKPNQNPKEIDAQTIYSLIAVNFKDMMPDDPKLFPPRLRPFIEEALGRGENGPLEKCLEEIKKGTIYRDMGSR